MRISGRFLVWWLVGSGAVLVDGLAGYFGVCKDDRFAGLEHWANTDEEVLFVPLKIFLSSSFQLTVSMLGHVNASGRFSPPHL